MIVTPPRYGWGTAEYCDQPVCLCVCLSVREHISGTAAPIRTKFCAEIPCGRGSVLLRRRCAAFSTSSFMDDVTFGRNGRDAERWRLTRSDGDQWRGDTGAESNISLRIACNVSRHGNDRSTPVFLADNLNLTTCTTVFHSMVTGRQPRCSTIELSQTETRNSTLCQSSVRQSDKLVRRSSIPYDAIFHFSLSPAKLNKTSSTVARSHRFSQQFSIGPRRPTSGSDFEAEMCWCVTTRTISLSAGGVREMQALGRYTTWCS